MTLRMRTMSVVGLVLAGVASSGVCRTATAQQKRPITLDDFAKIVSIASPAISHDGTRIAAVISRVNMKDDRHDTQLVLIDLRTGALQPLTFHRLGVAHPLWSTHDERLAFLSEAETGKHKAKKTQVFVLSMAGGDARKITDAQEGVEQFTWDPDGTSVAYATPDPPDEKALAQKEDSFEMGDDGLFTSAAPRPQHIWIVKADGSGNRRLTSGTWSLPESAPNVAGPPPLSWSRNGQWIVFPRRATPSIGDADESTIWEVNVSNGRLRKLTRHERFEETPFYSPDGSKVSYEFPRKAEPSMLKDLYVAPAAGGDGSDVTTDLDLDIDSTKWMPDGKSLLMEAAEGGHRHLWIQTLGGGAKELALGDLEPGAFSVGPRGEIAFVASSDDGADELYYLASANAQPRRLTDLNTWMDQLALGRTEGFDWVGPGHFHEDGAVTYPAGYTAGKKYPLVLEIHGGPRGASTVGFSAFAQYLAAQGFIVFAPNYRGSTNLGNAYAKAIFGDSGDGPGRDVMAGIAALEKHASIDESRIGVSGWSYGGYMTTWLIGHYHIWKTAVAGAPVTDFVNQYDWADNNVGRKYIYSGSPWVGRNMAKYREASPITYVGDVTTPLLLLHDVRDPRVSITNSFEFFHALRDRGQPVKFIAFPVVGHFPPDPVHQIQVYSDWAGWMVQHLR
ncbi:MAG: S9 family peptidase [Gammaproteobacteria bacterium]|nr:S9 family peptidase [Gammaproteobacteria bacterium]